MTFFDLARSGIGALGGSAVGQPHRRRRTRPDLRWGGNPAGRLLEQSAGEPARHASSASTASAERRIRNTTPLRYRLVVHSKARLNQSNGAREATAVRLVRPQQQRRERGTQRERAERGEQHGDRDGQRELLVDFAADAADESHRDEHGRQNERDGHHGRGHFRHGARVASFGVMPSSMCRCTASTTTIASSTTMPIASTRPNMLVILMEKPEQREQRECADYRDRHRQQRNQRGAPVLQEDEHHQDHEADRFRAA